MSRRRGFFHLAAWSSEQPRKCEANPAGARIETGAHFPNSEIQRHKRFDERSARIETGAHSQAGHSRRHLGSKPGFRGLKPSSMSMAPPEPLRRQGWQQRRYGNTCSQLQESQGSSPRRERGWDFHEGRDGCWTSVDIRLRGAINCKDHTFAMVSGSRVVAFY